MTLRNLGNSGIAVPPLCLGTNVFGWTADEPTAFRLLDAAVAAGLNFLDTADVYSRWVPGNHGGESETMIGNWLKRTGSRKNLIIATKVGMEMGPGKKGLSARQRNRCAACRPTTSISTCRTKTTPTPRCKKPSKPTRS